LVEISAKNEKLGHMNPIFGKLGVTHDLGWWLVGKPVVDCLFALMELFFAVYYGSRVMSRNVYSSAVFTGSRFLCTKILPGQDSPPSTVLSIRKLWGTRRWEPHPSALPHFDTILECVGQI